MKTTAILMGALIVVHSLSAQDSKTYKTKFAGAGKSLLMNIDAKQLDIEGYNGDEVIIEASNIPELPKEADGLRPLSSAGVENTNTGLSADINGNTLSINSVMKGKAIYKIRVPKEVAITVKKRNSCSCNEAGMSIKGMEGPLEINTNYEEITLLDVTGPIVAHSNQGKIKVIFDEKMPDKPSSIVSYGDHVDVTIPEKAKLLLSVSSSNGNMFTDLDLKPYKEENPKREVEEREIKGGVEKLNNVTISGSSANPPAKEGTTATSWSSSKSASAPSVYYWDGDQWTGNTYTFNTYAAKDYDRSAPKYVLNEPQTKITIRTTQGNVYLRKKK